MCAQTPDAGSSDGAAPGDATGAGPTLTFVSTTYNAPMNGVSDSVGCQYSVSASGTVTFKLTENSGVVTGTATTAPQINVVTTYTPPNNTCSGNPFTAMMSGNLSGNDASLNANLRTVGGAGTFAFTGSRSGSTMTGSATLSYNLADGSGKLHLSSGSTGTFTATEQ